MIPASAAPSRPAPAPISPFEKRVVAIATSIFFVNAVDFMMVAPLGPDLAAGVGIDPSQIAVVVGSYTAAASVSGLVASLFLDRFDRRKALGWALAGLVVGTLLAAFAWDLRSLVLARVVAGAFGGPAMSLVFAIVADVVPPARRGNALGTVMGAFAVSSVLGLPLGIELARRGGWRAPFVAMAALGAIIGGIAIALLPPMRAHLDARRERMALRPDLRQVTYAEATLHPLALLSLASGATLTMVGFLLMPNIAGYVQMNVGFPRERFGLLYLVGGVAGFVTTRVVGKAVDRFGSLRVGIVGWALFCSIVFLFFVRTPPVWATLPLFVALMTTGSLRHVPYATLASKVPTPDTRARFASVQSSVEHMGSAIAAVGSARLLSTDARGMLVGMPRVALLSMMLMTVLVPLFWLVETRVKARLQAEERARASDAGDASAAAHV